MAVDNYSLNTCFPIFSNTTLYLSTCFPFPGLAAEVSESDIKKLSGVAQGSLKKVSSITEANINKVAGITAN